MECLIDNNPEGVMEMVEAHLEAVNKSTFTKEAGVSRSTLYKMLEKKNPTIKTLAKIVHAAYHVQS